MYVFYVHQVFMEATGIEFTGIGVVNCLVWVLGTESGSSTRVVNAFNQ